MEWQLILALALLVPCVLMPTFFIWNLNRRGAVFSVRFTRNRVKPVAMREKGNVDSSQYEEILLKDVQRYLNDNPPVLE